tara:strand:- start:186 stop:1127 length:942 start_codon:yes stop_codon:yes gene_type:complete
MKKSDLKRIIREEIQKLNEVQTLVGQISGQFTPDPPGGVTFNYKCTYSGGGIVYTNTQPCPDTPTSGAPGDVVHSSSDFKRPDKKVKDPNYLGLSGGSDSQPGSGGQSSYNCVNNVCQPVQGLGGDFMSLAECQASGCEPNPDDFSGGVGHPGGPGRSRKTRLREQNASVTWDGNCGSILTHYVGNDLKALCSKCDPGTVGPGGGSYEMTMDPSPCDCDVEYAGGMQSLSDFCRAKFPNLGLGLGTDTDDPIDDPLDASTGTYIGTAIPAEPEKGPKPGLPGKPEDDGKLPFSILKRAGIKPKPRAPRRPRRR